MHIFCRLATRIWSRLWIFWQIPRNTVIPIRWLKRLRRYTHKLSILHVHHAHISWWRLLQLLTIPFFIFDRVWWTKQVCVRLKRKINCSLLLVSSGNVPFFNLKMILHLSHSIPFCSWPFLLTFKSQKFLSCVLMVIDMEYYLDKLLLLKGMEGRGW